MGTTDAEISNASFNAEKAIQRNPAKNTVTESVYCLSIHIERTTFLFCRIKKESRRLLKIYGIASSNMLLEF